MILQTVHMDGVMITITVVQLYVQVHNLGILLETILHIYVQPDVVLIHTLITTQVLESV